MSEAAESVRLQLNDVEIRKSSTRQTPITAFGTILKRGMLTGLNVAGSTAGYALPSAAVVGAAISGYGMPRDAENPSASGYLSGGSFDGVGMGSGMGGEGMGGMGDPFSAVAKKAAGGDSSAQMMMATQKMQEMNNMFNLQYLQIQQGMQKDSREFTMVSNIMKAKHDTARNSLSNLK